MSHASHQSNIRVSCNPMSNPIFWCLNADNFDALRLSLLLPHMCARWGESLGAPSSGIAAGFQAKGSCRSLQESLRFLTLAPHSNNPDQFPLLALSSHCRSAWEACPALPTNLSYIDVNLFLPSWYVWDIIISTDTRNKPWMGVHLPPQTSRTEGIPEHIGMKGGKWDRRGS